MAISLVGTLDINAFGSADAARAAERFAEIMGVELEGRQDESGNVVVRVNATLRLFFYDGVDGFRAPMHKFYVRFRVDGATLDGIVRRLRSLGVAYGSRSWDPANGRTDHLIGTPGLFWVNEDGHMFEIMTADSGREILMP